VFCSIFFIRCSVGKVGGTQTSRSARVVLVYFLGGCTYSEVTALRFLGKQRGIQLRSCLKNKVLCFCSLITERFYLSLECQLI